MERKGLSPFNMFQVVFCLVIFQVHFTYLSIASPTSTNSTTTTTASSTATASPTLTISTTTTALPKIQTSTTTSASTTSTTMSTATAFPTSTISTTTTALPMVVNLTPKSTSATSTTTSTSTTSTTTTGSTASTTLSTAVSPTSKSTSVTSSTASTSTTSTTTTGSTASTTLSTAVSLTSNSTSATSATASTSATSASTTGSITSTDLSTTASTISKTTSPTSTPASSDITIGGIVGGILVLFLLLGIVIFFVHRRRRGNKQTLSLGSVASRSTCRNKPIKAEKYEKYYLEQHTDENYGFALQFEDLRVVGITQPTIAALCMENKQKNRYNNVLPYDICRVKLAGDINEDYINANYLPGYNSKTEFIGTQGPLPNTIKDFWRMIWEKDVHTVVMLTRCNEQGKVKCEKYWPSFKAQTYGHIQVHFVKKTPEENWIIRDFMLENLANGKRHNIRHFHFIAWPDHGVPENTDLLIRFRNLVREHMNLNNGNSPTVVHCSAGVGRTGTLIALDHLIHQIKLDNIVDIYGIVYELRMHRPLMVQTEEQYVFLNQCALDIIRSNKNSNISYTNIALEICENLIPGNAK